MKRVLLILLVGAVAVALAWRVALLPGRVTLALGSTTVETGTPVAAIGLGLLVIGLYVLLRLIGMIVSVPRWLRRTRAARFRRLGDQAVTRALVALAAGEAATARRESGRALRYLGETPNTLLLAAQAARLAGRETEAEDAFRCLAARADAAFLGLRGLLQYAVGREDWAAAAALAGRAEAAHPGATWLRSEREQLAIRTGAWKDALALAVPATARAGYAAAAAAAEPDAAAALRLAKLAWREDPALPAAALAYAARLRETGRPEKALDVLRRSWTARPHPDLADAALTGLDDALSRLRAGKRLVSGNAAHPETALLLARLSLAAGLTGEARHYLAAAETLDQRRVWLLAAELAEHDNADGPTLRDALRRAAIAEPDPLWHCRACGRIHPAWQPACTGCATPGAVVWESPGRTPIAAQPG